MRGRIREALRDLAGVACIFGIGAAVLFLGHGLGF